MQLSNIVSVCIVLFTINMTHRNEHGRRLRCNKWKKTTKNEYQKHRCMCV